MIQSRDVISFFFDFIQKLGLHFYFEIEIKSSEKRFSRLINRFDGLIIARKSLFFLNFSELER